MKPAGWGRRDVLTTSRLRIPDDQPLQPTDGEDRPRREDSFGNARAVSPGTAEPLSADTAAPWGPTLQSRVRPGLWHSAPRGTEPSHGREQRPHH